VQDATCDKLWYDAAMERHVGRENQKRRTRNAIVAAARDLLIAGRLPSLAEVAESALVSPATMYRYFPDQLSLLRAALEDALPGEEAMSSPIPEITTDPVERVARVTEAFLHLVLKRERLVRAVMALSLLRSIESPEEHQAAVALRPGYRLAWIAEALAPLEGKIDARVLAHLTNALAVIMSSEALVALQDVRGLDAEAAVESCVWSARTLVEAVVSNNGGEHIC
jgi:AcrR family transcriptional regulator